VHEYDDADRLVRSVSTREPTWTELDQAEVLALAVYRAGLCPLHGGSLADCTSHDDTGPEFHTRHTRCRAQDELLLAQDMTTLDRPGALLWYVTKKAR
jgi:hypothetical protein